MDFYKVLQESAEGESVNPYAAKTKKGKWIEGTISIDFLNKKFGQYKTAEEIINATNSEGLKLYFQWLKDEGKLN